MPEQSNVGFFHPGDPENADYFMPAPEEIGPLLSAHTTRNRTTKPKPLILRLLLGLLLGVGLAAALAVALRVIWEYPPATCWSAFQVSAMLIPPVTVVGVLRCTRFCHFCDYTGERGVARFTCSGSRERVRGPEVFLFEHATNLRIETTRHYVNGMCNSTTYRYRWTNDSGIKVFVLADYHVYDKLPPLHDKYHFALAAERAWSRQLLDRILPALQAGKSYTFELRGWDGICLSKDYLELRRNNIAIRFSPEDLAEIRVKEGKVSLKQRGAKEGWFSSTGVHSFMFADLANAQVFLMLMERMFGVAMY